MPPSRIQEQQRNGGASTSKVGSKSKRHHRSPVEQSNAVPGIHKVKASLRQTRRLLAKDNLAADVRVETERRLKALEAELQEAETAKKERAFAVRYHKIKFFERQKVTRKLTQTKKAFDAADDVKKQKLSLELRSLRIDLNYIQHYPKTKKYISLFPPEVRKGEKVSAASQADIEKTDKERQELRMWIQEQMEQGILPNEPELQLNSTQKKLSSQKWPRKGIPTLTKKDDKKVEDVREPEDEFFDGGDGDDDSSD